MNLIGASSQWDENNVSTEKTSSSRAGVGIVSDAVVAFDVFDEVEEEEQEEDEDEYGLEDMDDGDGDGDESMGEEEEELGGTSGAEEIGMTEERFPDDEEDVDDDVDDVDEEVNNNL